MPAVGHVIGELRLWPTAAAPESVPERSASRPRGPRCVPCRVSVQRLDTGRSGHHRAMSEGPGLPCRTPWRWIGPSCPAASESRPHHPSTP